MGFAQPLAAEAFTLRRNRTGGTGTGPATLTVANRTGGSRPGPALSPVAWLPWVWRSVWLRKPVLRTAAAPAAPALAPPLRVGLAQLLVAQACIP